MKGTENVHCGGLFDAERKYYRCFQTCKWQRGSC